MKIEKTALRSEQSVGQFRLEIGMIIEECYKLISLPLDKKMYGSFLLVIAFVLVSPQLAFAQSMEFTVMSFNVWTADGQTAKLAEIIKAGDADIVGLQEMNNGSGATLANQLGWHYLQQSGGDIQIVSRFPIIDSASGGAQFEFTPGHTAWLFNCHFAAYPYQPYDLRDNPSLSEAQLIAGAESTRGAQFDSYLNTISWVTTPVDRVFFVGDFNEPPHVDWTTAAAAATPRTFDKKVVWPGSEKVLNEGFLDSFRVVRTDETNDRGYTWTPRPGSNEVHDRIDIVYFRGPDLSVSDSVNLGLDNLNPNTDIAVPGFNSDHRAVSSRFLVSNLQSSTLTFSRLEHNPGNDSALNSGNYGDRLVTSPGIVLQYSASTGNSWDTYDGDADGTNNNWNVGVAQLQSGGGDGVFDLEFSPDSGVGVIVESFELVDYVNFAVGHTVNWELWDGNPAGSLLLASGQQVIAADAIETVNTGIGTPVFGDVTLRLTHVTGSGSDLAIDNVVFRQVPKLIPSSLTLVHGTQTGGSVADLAESDDLDLSIQRNVLDANSRTGFIVEGISSVQLPSSISITLEGSVFSRANVIQRLELYNFQTGEWEQVDARNASRSGEATITASPTGDDSRFVEPGTGLLRARVRYESPVNRAKFASNTDHVFWVIVP